MVIFLLLVILTGGGLLAYKYFFARDTSYLGSWEREVDLRMFVMEEMNEWFGDPAVAANVVYNDTPVNVKVVLRFTKDGKFYEELDEASYSEAKKAAGDLAVSGLYSFLEKRLENAGTDTESVGKTIDELIEEALSMSAAEYLDKKGPALLPTLDALKEMYGINGSYEVKDNTMKRTCGGKSICEIYFTKDEYLMFTAKGTDIFEKSLGEAIPGTETELKMLYDYPVMYSKK